jgi:hypothetical protein
LRKEKAVSDLEGYSLGGGKLEAEIKGVVVKRGRKMHRVFPSSGQIELKKNFH